MATRGGDRRSLQRALRGDLDRIVLKALEWEPELRYGGPAELVADLERYLQGEPVLARPQTGLYRLRKLVQRHRTASVAVAGMVLALVLGAAGSGVGLVRARESEREARAQAERARVESATAARVSDFLIELFEGTDPLQAGARDLSARELLDRGAEHLQSALTEEPLLRARLLVSVGSAYRGLGLLEEAETFLRSSLEIHEKVVTEPRDEARARTRLSRLLVERGRPEEAESEALQAVEHLRAAGVTDPVVRADALSCLGSALTELGRLDEGRERFEEALVLLRGTGQRAALAETLHASVRPLLLTAEYELAETRALRVVELFTELRGPDHPQTASAYAALAEIEVRQGRTEEAEDAWRRARRSFESALGGAHLSSLRARGGLASVLLRTGRPAEARALLEEGLFLVERSHPDNMLLRVNFTNDLAGALQDSGDLDSAWRVYGEAVDLARRELPGHPLLAFALNNMGELARKRDEPARARDLYRESYELKSAVFAVDHPTVVGTLRNLAILEADLGNRETAERLLRDALERLEPSTDRAAEGPRERLLLDLAATRDVAERP